MNAQIRKYVRNYQIVLTQSLSQYFASYIYTIQTNGAIQTEKYIATEIEKEKEDERKIVLANCMKIDVNGMKEHLIKS